MKLATMIKTAVMGLLGTAVWATVPGCGGPSIGSYCDKVCDCTGCSESKREDCVDTIDDARKLADKEGCAGEFDAVLSCASSELTCKDDKVQVDGCEGESEDLFKCSSKINLGIGKNACEALADKIIAKYEGCGIAIEVGDGSGETQCSAAQEQQARCLTPCIDLLSCKCLDSELISAGECTQELANQYISCVSDCSE